MKKNSYVLDARTTTDHFPGIGRYVSNLGQAMATQLLPNEELLFLQNPGETSDHWQMPTTANINTIVMEKTISPFSIRQQWAIPQQLHQHQATMYHSPYYLMPYRPKVPTVVTIYDLIPQLFPQTVSLQARLLSRLATRLALRSANHIIVISETTRRDLLAAFPIQPEKVTAVPLAPDPIFQPQPESTILQIRHKYNLPETYALYLGSNKPHKNLVRLLEAWKIIIDEQENPPQLIIAGAWINRYPEPQQKAAEFGIENAVQFLGPIPEADLAALYSSAALFVFPSLYEGFGLPVIEAMACGTAVSCANSSSLPEIGSDAAHYFDPTNVREMATVIGRLLANDSLRFELEEKGKTQAQNFSWKKAANSTLQIYRHIT
ncbi:MAG: glycosyltransferase family 1 protein [Chloroflexi bacterium]|nr:MAG: glycosyltransferase family 1 protein [Chloroflexota bacterium]